VNRTSARGAEANAIEVQEFDFGTVLARGQALRHDFTLSNRTDKPLNLLKAGSSTPCCSAIGPVPKTIPPGSSVQIPIVVKTANKAGPLRIAFGVEAESSTPRVFRLSVSVRLLPEWEIQPEGEPVSSLSLGRSGKVAYRISCRRIGDDGIASPESVKASGPIKVSMAAKDEEAPPRDRRHYGGDTQSRFGVVPVVPGWTSSG